MLLLDRYNWFISALVKDNIKTDKSCGTRVNLLSQIIKKHLGVGEYIDVELCLRGLGIITINEKYSSTNFSKSFLFSPKAIRLGVEETLIYSKKFNIKLKTLESLDFTKIELQPVLKNY